MQTATTATNRLLGLLPLSVPEGWCSRTVVGEVREGPLALLLEGQRPGEPPLGEEHMQVAADTMMVDSILAGVVEELEALRLLMIALSPEERPAREGDYRTDRCLDRDDRSKLDSRGVLFHISVCIRNSRCKHLRLRVRAPARARLL